MQNEKDEKIFDLFVIGGGVNGCGVARDAAGRGMSVALAEMSDIGGATSSASTKLFHGGLRYLEFFEISLVRKALKEREVLLRAMPHIAWPMRFIVPLDPEMRFPGGTPTANLLGWTMPWLKGRRPAWLIRLGLFLYDNLGGRKILPATTSLNLTGAPEGKPLISRLKRAYEYSDCWVQDNRLVVLNAQDAAKRGAQIMPRCKVISTVRRADLWIIETDLGQFKAKAVVNAGGPWVSDVLGGVLRVNTPETIRLVRGSHIVTPRIFDHDKCYFFQGSDGRIIFAIPYEQDFTLIGTTDQDHDDLDQRPVCSDEEADYLREFAGRYFNRPIEKSDVVWTYSGVRPLYDEGSTSATAATREYVLSLDRVLAPVVSVFGGKITTYRKLAEAVLEKLSTSIDIPGGDWTAEASLPGGDFPVDGAQELTRELKRAHPELTEKNADRLIKTYGTQAAQILDGEWGPEYGAGIFETELKWVVQNEWVRTGEDYLWRRTKMGLRISPDQANEIDRVIKEMAETAVSGRLD